MVRFCTSGSLFKLYVLCRLTRNFNTPTLPPTRAFDYSLCSGSVEFDLCLGTVGKIEPKLEGFK